MKEELIISGRMNPHIDPVMNIWHWSIPLYLFLGGLAAGLLFFAAYQTIMGKDKKFLTSVRIKDIYPVHKCKLGFIRKIAAWIITTNDTKPEQDWDWKHKIIRDFEKYIVKDRKPLAWAMAILAIVLGVYTGILLSAFNARPLWNTAILGPLFLTSGLSTGAALLMIMTKDHFERISYSKIDILLVIIELFFITHWFMGYQAGSEIKVHTVSYFLGGEFTVTFWVNVIILGLTIPLILEVMELMKFKIPVIVPGLLIIWGGLAFRFIMVDAGQVIRYLY